MLNAKARPRILLAGGGTGGHLYPALALAEAVRRRCPDAVIVFVGARRGIEARVLPASGWPHRLLPFEPLRRSRVWENWCLLPAAVRVWRGLRALFAELRPHLVVGTGGYASGPAVAYGRLRGIPTAIQEQNSYPGLTTRLLARWVDQVHLAFPEAHAHLRPGRRTEVHVLGNPIRPPDFALDPEDARRAFGLGPGPVVLVIGGSQGARAINVALIDALAQVRAGRLPPLPAGWQILWATGPAHFDAVQAALREHGIAAVRALPYIDAMPHALRIAALAVSRAGAMALAELCAWGIPMILIPYPYAAGQHQDHNARALETAGAACVLPESELDGARLWTAIVDLANDDVRRHAMAEAARARGRPDAADRIVETLWRLLPADVRSCTAPGDTHGGFAASA